MKSNLAIVMVIVSLVVAIFSLIGMKRTQERMDELQKQLSSVEAPSHEHHEEHELAVYMQRLQWYSNKLYFAGKSENSRLTEFYLHELEEVMEEVVEAKIIDEGKNISTMMETYGLSIVERASTQMPGAAEEDFLKQYHALTESCNSCHVVSDHKFIKIIEPTLPVADNQKYSID